jgi:hypothetical protein
MMLIVNLFFYFLEAYPLYIYTDNCCLDRGWIKGIFPDALVLLDLFHFSMRFLNVAQSYLHPRYHSFKKRLNEVIFEDESKTSVIITSSSSFSDAEGSDDMSTNNNMKGKITHSRIKSRKEFELALTSFITNVIAEENEYDEKDRLFINLPLLRDTLANQLVHVSFGCMEDPPIDMIITDSAGKLKKCIRGTNDGERYHSFIISKFPRSANLDYGNQLLIHWDFIVDPLHFILFDLISSITFHIYFSLTHFCMFVCCTTFVSNCCSGIVAKTSCGTVARIIMNAMICNPFIDYILFIILFHKITRAKPLHTRQFINLFIYQYLIYRPRLWAPLAFIHLC